MRPPPIRHDPSGRPPARAPLAERLVHVTEGLLAREGIEGITLRRIARDAGVTHGAPLRHYRSFGTLLAEVAARGFRALSAEVDREAGFLPPGAGPNARLAAAARAYLRSAVANPGLFALMFRPEVLDRAHEGYERDANESFEQLVRLVRASQDAGWHVAMDTRRLAGSLWASIHGLASLYAQGAYPSVVPGTSLEEALDAMLHVVFGTPLERSPS
jgi:AcrR family transcriptional regulator